MQITADDRVNCPECRKDIIIHQYAGTGKTWWSEPCYGKKHKLTPRVKCPHGKLRENCIKCDPLT
jgi:hypothetical protein